MKDSIVAYSIENDMQFWHQLLQIVQLGATILHMLISLKTSFALFML